MAKRKTATKDKRLSDLVADTRKNLRMYEVCRGCGTHMLGIVKNPNGSTPRKYCESCDEGSES